MGIGCPQGREEIPYVETITVIPTQCGTFTNTVIDSMQRRLGGGPASATFTVNCQPPCPPQEFSQNRIQSGPASPSERVTNAGNNANLSPTAQQVAQTGNVANEQGVVQCASETGDIGFTGSSLSISPSLSSDTTQTIDQAAAAN